MHGKIDFLSFLWVKMAEVLKYTRSLAPIWGDSHATGKIGPSTHIGLEEGTK